MCGIAAVGMPEPSAARAALQVILRRLSHRGEPGLQAEDAVEGQVALGTNRLAIQSPTGGTQPLYSGSGNIRLVYNGELYNYRELAARYRTPSNRLAASGDGAVIADALEKDGIESISSFNGMFAMIWLDRRTGEVHWARDRIGIKPLYWASDGSRLFLSSELKGLASDSTIETIDEVQPGTVHTAHFDSQRGWLCESRAYWAISEVQTSTTPIDIKQLEDVLIEAVRRCLDCPKRVGVYLSGGLDSAGVFAIARTLGHDVVPLVLGGRNAIDAPYACDLAASFGCRPLEAQVPEEASLFNDVRSTIQICETFEPNVIRQSSVQRWITALGVEQQLKVVLCGEGADELFCGYPEMLVAGERLFQIRRDFMRDLHRTQLQRVDRVSMNTTTEVRVPYLLNDIVELALSCENVGSFVEPNSGMAGTKMSLRRALANVLPKPWIDRPKVVLSEGVGLGGNDPLRGLFSRLASQAIDPQRAKRLSSESPDWHIVSSEEALYFDIFRSFGYHKCRTLQQRVLANRASSVQDRKISVEPIGAATFSRDSTAA